MPLQWGKLGCWVPLQQPVRPLLIFFFLVSSSFPISREARLESQGPLRLDCVSRAVEAFCVETRGLLRV
jgi:hypothetical protein